MTTRASIRRLPCPVPDPPFDDEVGIRPGNAIAPTQGALALAFMLPTGVPAEPEPPATLRLVDDPAGGSRARPDEPDAFVAEFTARRPTSGDALPDPHRWAARLAQAIAEVLHGHRPVQQLLRWTDDAVYAAITNRLASRRRTGSAIRPVLRSIRVCSPTDGVAEASAVVQRGDRCRAMALRLEGLDGQWRCTAFEII